MPSTLTVAHVVGVLADLADEKGIALSYADREARLDLSGIPTTWRLSTALCVMEHLAAMGGRLTSDGDGRDATVNFGSVQVVVLDAALAAEQFAAGVVA